MSGTWFILFIELKEFFVGVTGNITLFFCVYNKQKICILPFSVAAMVCVLKRS
jgi:hypothetical protein